MIEAYVMLKSERRRIDDSRLMDGPSATKITNFAVGVASRLSEEATSEDAVVATKKALALEPQTPPAFIIAHAVKEATFSNLFVNALAAYQTRRIPEFITLIDMADGLNTTTNFIMSAEEESQELAQAKIDQARKISGNLNPAIDSKIKELKAWASELFDRDQSGFLLLDEIIKRFGAEFSKPPKERTILVPGYETPDFFMLGATTAANTYKKLYQLIEPISS